MSAEQEPYLPLQWGDKELRMTAQNSQLYTFLGRAAIEIGNEKFEIERSALNHVWIATRKDAGMYFWAEHDPEQYQTMAGFIIEHQFPAYLNARAAQPCDIQAWLQEVDKTTERFVAEIPDTLPDK